MTIGRGKLVVPAQSFCPVSRLARGSHLALRRDRAIIGELLQVPAETDGRWWAKPATSFAAHRGSEDPDEFMLLRPRVCSVFIER